MVGTDDGLIQITEDGGKTWRKVSAISGAPNMSYLNNVHASKHNANVIYAAFNHHKYGDFKPYLFKSSDKGRTWTSISGNLPERGSVYAFEEDHKDANLLFCGTEFGVYFTPNSGGRWKKLGNGLPTTLVRDIAIQERENDLVLGTFGRGFYVLDDYSSLRTIENENPKEKAIIYPIRTALMWEKSTPLGLPGKSFQGDNFYTSPNLDPEVMITYYYDDTYESLKDQRQKREKDLVKGNKSTPYPSYNALKAENNESAAQLLFVFKDASGNIIKKETKSPTKGLQRFHWDLRYTPQNPVNFNTPAFYNPFSGKNEGTLVVPGTYTVEMQLFKDGIGSSLGSFFESLFALKQRYPTLNLQLNLVGHSMGTIAINNLLEKYESEWTESGVLKNVVYMAAAASTEETLSIVPDLMKSDNSFDFFNLTLNRVSEVAEFYAFGFAPSGSLLVSIDKYHDEPEHHLKRTFGSEINVRSSLPAILKSFNGVKGNVVLKSFNDIETLETSFNIPVMHGDFGDLDYWLPSTWAITNANYEKPTANQTFKCEPLIERPYKPSEGETQKNSDVLFIN